MQYTVYSTVHILHGRYCSGLLSLTLKYFLVTVLLYNVQYIHICKGDIVWSIDKLNTKIGNVFRLHLRIEPFSVMFWALCIVLCTYTKTVDPACRPGIPQQWYWHSTVRLGSVRINLSEDESATCLFRSCCIINL